MTLTPARVRTRGWRAERRPANRGAPCYELLDFEDGEGRPQRPVFINTGANAWILVVLTGAFLNFRAASQAGLNGCGRRALALAGGAGPVDGAVALLPVRRVPDLIVRASRRHEHDNRPFLSLPSLLPPRLPTTPGILHPAFDYARQSAWHLQSALSNLSRRFLILIYERTLHSRCAVPTAHGRTRARVRDSHT